MGLNFLAESADDIRDIVRADPGCIPGRIPSV